MKVDFSKKAQRKQTKKSQRKPAFSVVLPEDRKKKESQLERTSKENVTRKDTLLTTKQVVNQRVSQKKSRKQFQKILSIHPIKSWGSHPEEGFIRYTHGYFEIVRMRGHNLFGMKAKEFQQITNSYAALTNLYTPPFKLVSIHSPVDTSMQQKFFQTKYQQCTQVIQRKMLSNNYEELAFIGKYRQSEEFFIFIYGYDEEKLRENLDDFYHSKGLLQIERLSKEEKVQLLFRMANPMLKFAPLPMKELVVKNRRILEEKLDVQLLQRIQPQGNFKAAETYIQTGSGYQACLHVYKLQSEPAPLWLLPFTRIKDKLLTLDVATQDDTHLRQDIRNAIRQLGSTISQEKDPTEKELKVEEYRRLVDLSKDITRKREILKYCSIRLYLYAESLQALEKRVLETRKKLEKEEFGLITYTLEQEYEWQSLFLDYFSQQLLPNRRSGLDIASTEFGSSYPANEVSLKDPRGKYFGLSNTGGQMLIDFFENTETRTFYNILITGLMGYGKTTLMKKIMDMCISLGYMVRGFDKSGEFTELIRKRKGTIIRLDGQDGRLNIFEVFPLAINDETLQINESASMTIHLAKLGTWYSILKPQAPIEELDLFDTVVTDLYTEKGFLDEDGIVGQVTRLKPEEYPILTDLIALVEKKMAQAEYEIERNLCFNIHTTLRNLIKKTRDMFNGPTTVPDLSEEQILFFNIDGLTNFDDRYVNAQLFNAFNLFSSTLFNHGRIQGQNYKNNEVSFDFISRGMFFMAEAHNLLNPNNPRMVSYFNTYAREARKRFAGLCLDTQTARSLQSRKKQRTNVTDETSDIYDFMQYRFFFRPGEGEEEELSESNGGVLTDVQAEKIAQFGQGQTLLRIGKDAAYEMFVYASDEELDLYNGGGRKNNESDRL